RMLLDSFLASDDVYGRLRKVSRDLAVDVPAVSSVVGMASSGNVEAMGRLLELARAATSDEKASAEVADALVEVARTAPDELLVSMRKAPNDVRDSATSLLAAGMVKAAD